MRLIKGKMGAFAAAHDHHGASRASLQPLLGVSLILIITDLSMA
jgi:hypothetical protein